MLIVSSSKTIRKWKYATHTTDEESKFSNILIDWEGVKYSCLAPSKIYIYIKLHECVMCNTFVRLPLTGRRSSPRKDKYFVHLTLFMTNFLCLFLLIFKILENLKSLCIISLFSTHRKSPREKSHTTMITSTRGRFFYISCLFIQSYAKPSIMEMFCKINF